MIKCSYCYSNSRTPHKCENCGGPIDVQSTSGWSDNLSSGGQFPVSLIRTDLLKEMDFNGMPGGVTRIKSNMDKLSDEMMYMSRASQGLIGTATTPSVRMHGKSVYLSSQEECTEVWHRVQPQVEGYISRTRKSSIEPHGVHPAWVVVRLVLAVIVLFLSIASWSIYEEPWIIIPALFSLCLIAKALD